MTILITDDEYYTVAMLCEQINWELLGINRVLKAYNGKDALEIIEKERPDIVLCDIEMPQMSGLEVQKAAAQKGIHCRFLFLTSFEKFEYVRDAMHYGAQDYLTKPFEMSDVFSAISRQVQSIQKEQESRQKENYWKKNRVQITQDTLRSVLEMQSPDRDEIQRLFERNGIMMPADQTCRLILVLPPSSDSSPKDILMFALENMTSEILCKNLTFQDIIPIVAESGSAIAAIRTDIEEGSIKKDMQILTDAAEKYFKSKITCLASNAGPLWNISQEYARMRQFLRHMIPEPGIYFMDSLPAEPRAENTALDQNKISRWLEARNKESIVQYLGNELSRMQKDHQLSQDVLLRTAADLEQEVYSYLRQRGIQAHMLYHNDQAVRLRRRASRSPFHLTQWADYLCQAAFDELDHLDDTNTVIHEITQFIQEHYKEKITRQDIADYVYLTPNYISKLFHEETDMSLPDYISQVRIAAAKNLMLKSSWTIGEIALEVGFESMAYFSTTFKKICGMTPAQWRSAQ